VDLGWGPSGDPQLVLLGIIFAQQKPCYTEHQTVGDMRCSGVSVVKTVSA